MNNVLQTLERVRGRLLLSGMCAICLASVCLAASSTAFGAVSSFDGSYSGKSTLTKGSDSTCPTTENISVTVRDGRFTSTDSNVQDVLSGLEIAQDGSFGAIHQGSATWMIRGRISSGVLEADFYRSADCVHHWSLKKK